MGFWTNLLGTTESQLGIKQGVGGIILKNDGAKLSVRNYLDTAWTGIVGQDQVTATSQAEVTISSATSLSSTHLGKVIDVEGSSDYTIKLPGVTGADGYAIQLKFRQNAGVLVTIQASDTPPPAMETLTTRSYIAGESVIFRVGEDGWEVENENLRKPWFKATRTSNQSIADATFVTVAYDTETDSYGLWNNSTYVFTANRPGRWEINNNLVCDGTGMVAMGSGFRQNTTSGNPTLNLQAANPAVARRLPWDINLVLAKGNTLQPTVYLDATSGNVVDYTEAYIQARWIGHE